MFICWEPVFLNVFFIDFIYLFVYLIIFLWNTYFFFTVLWKTRQNLLVYVNNINDLHELFLYKRYRSQNYLSGIIF